MHGLVSRERWKLVTSPGTSPENKYITPDGYVGATSYGNTSDLAMIRECLIDAAEASKVLGVDKSFRKRIKKTLSRLYPYQVGKDGNLQEWYYDWQDQDPYHRHQSHLFGLYPGHHLSVEETPELAAACARTLQIKGDETTGWSTGWRVNLLARLRDGEKPIICIVGFFGMSVPITIKEKMRGVGVELTRICWMLIRLFK